MSEAVDIFKNRTGQVSYPNGGTWITNMIGETPATLLTGTGAPDGDAEPWKSANKGTLYQRVDNTDDLTHLYQKVDEGNDDNDWVEVPALNGPITATAAEINQLDGMVADDLTIGIGADAGTTIAVTIQLKDANGVDLATRAAVFAYLSDDANGDSIAGTAPSGGWAIGTDGLLIPVVANKAAYLVSEADGDIDIVITEAAGDTWYLIVVLPNGLLKASGAITFSA